MKTQSEIASAMGLKPVCFKSLIEIADPTKNKVTTSKRLEMNTMLPVIAVGRTP